MSGKLPYYPMYPMDWDRDMEEHPLEIIGAWIQICNKLWWSKTRGKAEKTVAEWARILRVDVNKAMAILWYLRSHDIPTMHGDPSNGDSRVTLVSRRMVRDEKVRKIRQKCGKKGGNPLLKKQKKIGHLERLDNQNLTTQDNQNPTKNNEYEYKVFNKEETEVVFRGGKKRREQPRREPNPAVKTFIDSFVKSFVEKFGQPYCVNGGKEGAIAARLLQSHPIEKLLEFQKHFFAEEDEFLEKAGHTIGVFAARINKLAQLGRPEDAWISKVKSML